MKKASKRPLLNYPIPNDEWWNTEVEKIIPYTSGRGVDIGCANRTPFPDMVRVDINPDDHPDYVACGDKLPFKDNKFDDLFASHVLEHMIDTRKALTEWLRVVKTGGYILLIMPDRLYTGTRNQKEAPKPYDDPMWHYHEFTYNEFLEYLKKQADLNFKLIESGDGMRGWSYYAVLQKV
jgi:predicted SAM-dependent methyltransferase